MNEFTLKQIEQIWGNRICIPGYVEGTAPEFKTIEHLKEQYDSLEGVTGMIFLLETKESGFAIHKILVDKSAP